MSKFEDPKDIDLTKYKVTDLTIQDFLDSLNIQEKTEYHIILCNGYVKPSGKYLFTADVVPEEYKNLHIHKYFESMFGCVIYVNVDL